MASLNFYVQGNKHLHFKVLQIKINEKQTLLWVWRLYWKTGQGRNEYFLWFVKELHNECQVMWKAWHMVQARALFEVPSLFRHSTLGPRAAKQHTGQRPRRWWRMISLFVLIIIWLDPFSPQTHPKIYQLATFSFPLGLSHSVLFLSSLCFQLFVFNIFNWLLQMRLGE